MLKDDIKGKRFFVTGHTGFKGSWLCLVLEKLGAVVCGYSKEKATNSLIHFTKPALDSEVIADVCSYDRLRQSVFDFKPDYIIHLAAQAYVGKSLEEPAETFNTNVMGLVNVLRAAEEYNNLKSILVITSDKCYKNTESEVGYSEDAPLGAQDPYSTSKACQELVVESFRFSYFNKLNIPISTARASNVVGCADFNTDRLVPYLLEQLATNQKPYIRNPHAVRPWQNILDVLGGYISLAYKSGEDFSLAGAYNFGPGEQDGFKSVESLVRTMSRHFNDAEYSVTESALSSMETTVLKLDSKKAQDMLAWRQIYSFDETIKMAAEFKKRTNKAEDIKDICDEQINDYLSKFML